jgi:acetyl esterase
MPLDTPTRDLLDAMRAGGKPICEQTVDEARETVRTASAQLAGHRVDVHAVVDRAIPGPAGDITVRIYSPRAPSRGPSPIVLHYHGGGFVCGDLDTHDAVARYYCRHADAIVVSVDYRRPPEHRFPAAVDDSYAALCWAVDQAASFGGNPGRVAVTGDSAGANLSAVMCQLAKLRSRPAVAFQALLYPVVDLSPAAPFVSREKFGGGDYFLSNRDMEWFASLYLSDVPAQVKDPRASPLLAPDLAGLPPALVVTAGFDPLRDEGKAYADRLAADGVPVEYRCFESTIHAFASFGGAIPAGNEALALVASRLRRALTV